jgi:hypothetical protein
VSEIVRIELGGTLIDAELVTQSLRSRGIKVELIRNEHPETGGFFALGSSALLVFADDEAQVRALLEEHRSRD